MLHEEEILLFIDVRTFRTYLCRLALYNFLFVDEQRSKFMSQNLIVNGELFCQLVENVDLSALFGKLTAKRLTQWGRCRLNRSRLRHTLTRKSFSRFVQEKMARSVERNWSCNQIYTLHALLIKLMWSKTLLYSFECRAFPVHSR